MFSEVDGMVYCLVIKVVIVFCINGVWFFFFNGEIEKGLSNSELMVNFFIWKVCISYRLEVKVVDFESMFDVFNELSLVFGVIEEVKRKFCEIGLV